MKLTIRKNFTLFLTSASASGTDHHCTGFYHCQAVDHRSGGKLPERNGYCHTGGLRPECIYLQAENGDIWKGSYNISQSETLVDTIKKESGMDVTFFYGTERIMTSASIKTGTGS